MNDKKKEEVMMMKQQKSRFIDKQGLTRVECRTDAGRCAEVYQTCVNILVMVSIQ